jgi:hypothetical protein
LSEPIHVGAFAYLLSAHLPLKAEQLEYAKTAITQALQDAAAVGERLFAGEIAPLLAFECSKRDYGTLINIRVRPRAAIEWLLSKPKREHLVPDSLRKFMEDLTVGSNKRRHLTRKAAEGFVAEFVNCEKKAGRVPILKGLEAAAKAAGFRGGRHHLRDAFHHHPEIVVKEGRPSKLAK